VTTPTAASLYQQGRLDEAIAAMNEEVKQKPADVDRRGFLAELLCVAGELERAEKQLEVLVKTAPQHQLGVSLLRQLVRAEQSRQQFYADGRLPEFVEKPDARMELRLKAALAERGGERREAAKLLEEMEAARAPVAGTCDGKRFDEIRDLDDLVADALEVLTSNGKYYLIPFARVESIELRAPQRPRDLLWRRALVQVTDGPEGEVFLPAIYAGAYGPDDVPARLARRTDWSERDAGPVRGKGLRTLLVGDEAKSLLEIGKLEFGRAS
jgi:type VI secretion system protein ImpE